ncbi:hypothetical protein [Microbacterium ulmi]|uniref:Uncharacterized protein n=1 Tax=Microbacterium ulmi TaxID=179095 RepID=A0A7Y2Q247_9MICO|nr:hypothetical protein [Microbacterium ulmi]NII69508.1 hypothetical protein [Microbacterium ulmi]NNH05052.1 hypothetical protein [Microbacterium ulmi]
MEQILAVAADWWWIAPAVVGAGAVSYGALTTSRRRARRLEVDAARHHERAARAALVAARAQTRSAQAEVLAARAQTYPPVAGAPDAAAARRAHQAAKDAQRAASLLVRATHARTKAALQRYHSASKADPLPLQRLMAADDAVTARWMEYETDAARALAFPQLLDARHPATLAFLRAHREARRLRPAAEQTRVMPVEFARYSAAVRAAELAFDAAERAAIAAARGELPEPARTTGSAFVEAAVAFSEAATDRLRTIRWREVLGSAPPPTAAPSPSERPAEGVWPVPSRTSKPSGSP